MSAKLEASLLRVWMRRGPLACLLWPISLLLRALVGLRRLAYRRGWSRSGHAGICTVVIGNVVAGGAGKTPTAIAVLRHLQTQGWRPGLISRGYGRSTEVCVAVQPDSLPQEVGDEPLLIYRATGVPVVVARQRLQAAQTLRALHPEVNILVCDDGLQHLALQRDVEICVFDERGVGNGWLLPAGPLREPWPRAVDWVLHTAPNALRGTNHYRAQRQLATYVVNGHGQTLPLSALRDQPLLAVAGIARPEAFFAMLRDQGLNLAQTEALPDHHDYAHWHRPDGGLTLVCTEKDAAKLWQQHPEAWAVPLLMTPEPGFWAALDARLSSGDGHQTA